MREIKFRAWDLNNKRFVENEYLLASVQKNIITVIGVTSNGDKDCENEDVVLQQFTGRKDKNGKEIYEGDVIKASAEGIGEIFYRDDRGQFRISWVTGLWKSVRGANEPIFSNSSIVIEVIGNIYENPELINKTSLTGRR